MTLQLGWRNCRACSGTFFAFNETKGLCPARADGGPHDDTGSPWLGVHYGASSASSMQGGWRWCEKCQGMFFGRDNKDAGVCPAGGAHRLGRSGYYSLGHTSQSAAPTAGWRWCSRCEGLFYTDGASLGRCPAQGTHDPSTSGRYTLELDPEQGADTAASTSSPLASEVLSTFAWDEFRIGVLGVGTDGQMWHRVWDTRLPTWSEDWQVISGALGSVPVACGSGGFIHFFACDNIGKPRHLIWDGTATIARLARWDANGDVSLNGTLRAVLVGGTCHLFGLEAATGEVLHGGWTASLYPNAASEWTRCGQALTSLSVVLVGSDVHLVGVDSAGAILQAVWSSTAGGCSDWKTLTTGGQGSVALALVGARVHCCFLLSDGSMAWGRYEASNRIWVGTVQMGGGSLRSPTVAVVGQMLHVFALGASGVVQHVGWDVEVSSPGRWDDCGGALAGAPAAVVMMGSTVQVAGVTSAGTASCLSWNAGTNTAISAWVDGGGTLSTTLKVSPEATPEADPEEPGAPTHQPISDTFQYYWVLLGGPDGYAKLLYLDANNQLVGDVTYGSPPGWSPLGFSEGALAWKHEDGRVMLWRLGSDGKLRGDPRILDCAPGFTPINVDGGWILQRDAQGRARLVDPSGGRPVVLTDRVDGWTPVQVVEDHLIWRHSSGAVSIWSLDESGRKRSDVEHSLSSSSFVNYHDSHMLTRLADGRAFLVDFDEDGTAGGAVAIKVNSGARVVWYASGRVIRIASGGVLEIGHLDSSLGADARLPLDSNWMPLEGGLWPFSRYDGSVSDTVNWTSPDEPEPEPRQPSNGSDDWEARRLALQALRARVAGLSRVCADGPAVAEGEEAGAGSPDDPLTSVRRAPWSAVGDGVADDTEALAGALASGAKAIFVPEGVYRITRTLVVPAGVRLFGAGLFASVLLFDLPRAPAEGAHPQNDGDGRWRVEYGSGLLLDNRTSPRTVDTYSAAFGAAVEDLALVRSFASAGDGAGHGGYAIGARVIGSARIRVYVHGGWRWGLYKRQSNAEIMQSGAVNGAAAGGVESSDLWLAIGDGLRLPAVARQAERAGGGVYVRGFMNACRLHVEIASLDTEAKPEAVVLHGTYAAGNNLALSGSIQGVGGAAVRVSGVGQGLHIHDLHVEAGGLVARGPNTDTILLGATDILGDDDADWISVAKGVLRGPTVGPNVSANVVVGSGVVNAVLTGVNGNISIDQGAVETLVTNSGGASFSNASPTTRTLGWPRDLLTGFTPVGTAPMAGRNLLMDGNGERRCLLPSDSGLHHAGSEMPWEFNPIYTGIQRVRPAGGGTRSAPEVLHMWVTVSGRLIYWRIATARLAGLGGQPLCFSFKWRAIVQNSLPFLNISWGQLEPTQWGNLVDGVPCERGFSRAQIAFLVDAQSLEDGKDLYIALTAGHLDTQPLPAGALEELYLSEFMLQVGAAASPDWIPGEWSEDQSARLTRGRLEVWKALPRQSGPQREGDESWPYDVSAEDRDPVQQRHYLRGDVVWDTTSSKSGHVGMVCESGDATPRWRAISQRVGW